MLQDQQVSASVDTAEIMARTDSAVSDSKETPTPSVAKTEELNSNLGQKVEVVIEETPEIVPEFTESQVPEFSTDKKKSVQSFDDFLCTNTPSPSKIFSAFDTTGAAEVYKIFADDEGKALGKTELYKEVDSFLNKDKDNS